MGARNHSSTSPQISKNESRRRLDQLRSWLAHILDDVGFTMERASADASFRTYFRIVTPENSFIVMDAPPQQEDSRAYIRVAGLLREAGVNVPDILSANLEQGFLLLTDLGTRHYLDALDAGNADRLYGDAMGALLSIQACAYSGDLPPYDESLLRSEMRLFSEWLLHRHLGITLGEPRRRALLDCFDALCRAASEQPRVFVHRDYHSRNLMVNEHQNPGILDFQGAVQGPVTYDLVSLLRDAYIHWPAQRVRDWAGGYHDLAVQHGVLQEDDPVLWLRWFDLMGVQRHVKIAGIFARLYHRDGKPDYLRDIPPTLDYLTAVCADYPELHPLNALLSELRIQDKVETRNAQALAQPTT